MRHDHRYPVMGPMWTRMTETRKTPQISENLPQRSEISASNQHQTPASSNPAAIIKPLNCSVLAFALASESAQKDPRL